MEEHGKDVSVALSCHISASSTKPKNGWGSLNIHVPVIQTNQTRLSLGLSL